MEKLTVLVKTVDSENFEIKEVEGKSTYEILKTAVGGYIECVSFPNGIDLWLNEEGKLISLPFNTALVNKGKVLDIIVGDIIITGHDDEGETISLTKEQIDYFTSEILDTKMLITEQGMLPVLNFK